MKSNELGKLLDSAENLLLLAGKLSHGQNRDIALEIMRRFVSEVARQVEAHTERRMIGSLPDRG